MAHRNWPTAALLGGFLLAGLLNACERPIASGEPAPGAEESEKTSKEPVPVWDLLAKQADVIDCASLDEVTAPVAATTILDDRTNITVLIFDAAYQFEAGTVLQYPKCLACSDNELPVTSVTVDPADFGSISICTRESGSPVFTGTIVWAGSGEIKFPLSFAPPESFISGNSPALDKPNNIVSINNTGAPVEGEDVYMPDALWESASRLELVRDFARSSHPFILYMYQPSVGMGDPLEGKWVLMLYHP